MRCLLVAPGIIALALMSCTQLTVGDTLVYGEVHNVSVADVKAALAAVRAENPSNQRSELHHSALDG